MLGPRTEFTTFSTPGPTSYFESLGYLVGFGWVSLTHSTLRQHECAVHLKGAWPQSGLGGGRAGYQKLSYLEPKRRGETTGETLRTLRCTKQVSLSLTLHSGSTSSRHTFFRAVHLKGALPQSGLTPPSTKPGPERSSAQSLQGEGKRRCPFPRYFFFHTGLLLWPARDRNGPRATTPTVASGRH